FCSVLFCASRELHSFPTRRSSDLGLFRACTARKDCNRHIVSGLFITILARRLLGRSPLQTTRTLKNAAPPPVELRPRPAIEPTRSEEHTSELQSRENLVCRLLLEK